MAEAAMSPAALAATAAGDGDSGVSGVVDSAMVRSATVSLGEELDIKFDDDEDSSGNHLEVILPGVADAEPPLVAMAAWPAAPLSIRADPEDSCSCDSSDFESLSSVTSFSIGSAASSEIPEAILEDSSDGDAGVSARQSGPLGFGASGRGAAGRRRVGQVAEAALNGCYQPGVGGGLDSPRPPAVVSAWTPNAWIAPATTASGGGSTSSSPGTTRGHDASLSTGALAATGPTTSAPGGGGAAVGAIPATPRTPVRRARVRGTVRLPTANTPRRWDDEEEVPPLLTPRWAGIPSQRSPPLATATGVSRESLDEVEALALGTENFRQPRLRSATRMDALLETASGSQEVLVAQHVREAQDQQAVLQAIDEDREELHSRYLEVWGEVTWLRAELCRREAEVMELRQGEDELRRELSRTRSAPSQGTCVVCLDAPAAMASVPCGHLAMCEACVHHLDRLRCPVCRHPSETFIHIYAS